MQTITTRLYICQCVDAGTYQGTEGKVEVFTNPQHESYGPNGNADSLRMFGTWALLAVKDVEIEYEPAPIDSVAKDMIEKYETELSRHRAAAYRTETQLQGKIARFKAIAYKGPVESEIIPADDKPQQEIDAEDAEIVEPAPKKDPDLDIPF
ncbi:hypothetical protein HOU67_gp28 [Escherichia phage Skarpretter]|uniref:Uncharacterized protein n=1 Tax=Escherichia phage Skarpretter TaxID=2488654 RepID=A0A3G8F2V7_9CAUD|nr:hypothetical protein HOU67_gp28 [Escherichia phage Skarpretter]AZF88664.1 hypothetical protein [Escherichia phage Skarpretter]